MAFTQSDIDNLKSAIASGEKRVRLSDGRETEYRDVPALLSALALAEAEVAQAAGTARPRVIRTTVDKGC